MQLKLNFSAFDPNRKSSSNIFSNLINNIKIEISFEGKLPTDLTYLYNCTYLCELTAFFSHPLSRRQPIKISNFLSYLYINLPKK